MHNDMPTKMLDEGYDPDVRHTPAEGHTDLPRLAESGITAQFLAAWVDAPYAATVPDSSFARAMRYIDAIHGLVSRHPELLRFATTGDDVRHAKRDGKVAIFIGVEGGHAIEGSLDHLRTFYQCGARYLTLTWNNGNAWAGSSIGSGGTRTGGLTPFGEQVIREMERLGMLVDVSHTSDETLDDVLAIATRPVIASHSCARALADHPRNLTDAQLRAIARSGGVVNVNFYPRFLDAGFCRAMDAAESALVPAASAEERRAALAAIPPVPLDTLIDHIDHIARVAGTDHVGLGSDFDGIAATPAGLDDVTGFPRIARALMARGYSADDVEKVLGANMLRVLDDVLRAPA
ncbi:MAG: dipeptidase [Gemmatimonadaceae bacterium]|nr:dipeptidase [Gemmatimonadaceae bacterium]